MKDSMSRPAMSYGEQVSTDRSLAPEAMNIKGQNNGRQILTAIATGLAVGVTTTLGIFASNPSMLTETLPTIFATVGSMALVSAYNWLRGRSIQDVAKDIVDGVLGEEKTDERKG